MNVKFLQKGFDPNRKCDNMRWNCIDFALCNGDAHIVFQDLLNNSNGKNVVEIFKQMCRCLEIKTTQISYADITKYEDKSIICFYWWKECNEHSGNQFIEYHFLRKINNVWFEKEGQDSIPCKFSSSLTTFFLNELNPEEKAFFIIE